MSNAMTITLKQLRALGACSEQVSKFEKTFGKEVTLTREVVLEHFHAFDMDWLIPKILTPVQLKAYLDAKAPLWKAYQDAEATLWKAYLDARAPLWKAYQDARAPLLRSYVDARAPLWKAYQDARAFAFWEAINE